MLTVSASVAWLVQPKRESFLEQGDMVPAQCLILQNPSLLLALSLPDGQLAPTLATSINHTKNQGQTQDGSLNHMRPEQPVRLGNLHLQ